MKKIIYIILSVGTIISCARFDDSELWDKVIDHEDRIADLETLCARMNSNITALQSIVTAIEEYDYVTKITEIIEDGRNVGYVITFSKSGAVTIYHGKDGNDGLDGEDGKDGHSPVIGVKKGADGHFYWTLDGEWLLDDEGNRIPTTGQDGADGEDGKDGQDGKPGQDGADGRPGAPGADGADGKDGVTPLLKIEEDYWYISYDDGATWEKLDKAVGEDGKNGTDGADGSDGEDGKSFFRSIDTSDEDYVIFTLADGTEIKMPTWKAFEELQIAVNKLNTNISSLQEIVSAIESNDFVTGIVPVTENGKVTGYTISFSKSLPVTIYHGKDGRDGTDGEDGKDGEDGYDGKDGHTPVIGVREDTDGIYYWTIDGQWLLGEDGEKIPTTGRDGEDGEDGKDGKDGVTPVLKIADGHWYISYDGGKSWEKEPLGPAASVKDNELFSEITYDDAYVYMTLKGGETLAVPRSEGGSTLLCRFDPVKVEGRNITFTGCLDVSEEDLAFSQVTLYYSNAETFNIYTAQSISTTTFDKDGNFSFLMADLAYGTWYRYCFLATVKAEKKYSNVNRVEVYHPYSAPADLDAAAARDLSAAGSANSYIVSESGLYRFKAVKGNSSESVGDIASAAIIWETFGTAVVPEFCSLIEAVCHKDGYIVIRIPDEYKEGNALVAARDSEGNILWSWHIWLTDMPAGQIYYNDAGTMMDRNLGAVSAVPGDVGALGLLYQWGRKDPFLGSSSISEDKQAVSTIKWPKSVKSDSITGTSEYASAHPTTFITHNPTYKTYDWYFTDSDLCDTTRWAVSEAPKSVYDPCPPGWRVPDGDKTGVWPTAVGGYKSMTVTYDAVNRGYNLTTVLGDDEVIWYPLTGSLNYTNARLMYVSTHTYYQAADVYSSKNMIDTAAMKMGNAGTINPYYGVYRGRANPVRCISE